MQKIFYFGDFAENEKIKSPGIHTNASISINWTDISIDIKYTTKEGMFAVNRLWIPDPVKIAQNLPQDTTLDEVLTKRWAMMLRNLTKHATLLAPKEECERIEGNTQEQLAKNIVALIEKYQSAACVNFKVLLGDDGINLRFGWDYLEKYVEGQPCRLKFTAKELESMQKVEAEPEKTFDFNSIA